MPYIGEAERDFLRPHCPRAKGPGQLNFQITCLIIDYVRDNGLSYQHINDVLGALEGAKLEFYAREARPYEDEKIELNGDVY